MPRIAKVVSGIALDREFEYLIPEQVDGNVALGSRVLVPFGRTRTRGYVVGLASESDRQDLKSILSVDAPEPLLVDSVLRLVRWMSEYYCAPIEQVLKSVLPSPVRRGGMQHRRRLFVSVCDAESSDVPKLSAKQTATWSLLSGRGDMFLHEIIRELGITASPVRALEKKGLVKIGDAPDRRNPLSNRTILPTQPLALSDEQQGALDALTGMCDAVAADAGGNASRVMLLHGITGSGKTEVYLQAIEHVLEVGRTAIILVPEIALTPQTIERFVSRFGDAVAVLHSKLSDGERYDEWHRIRQGTARIVVGARSAVFAPTPNLGLVVVDEEHEPSYKQEEAPRYNARDVAVMRSRFDACAVVLGSATPSLESWQNATRGKYVLRSLTHRVDNRCLPAIRVVDMRAEAQASGKIGVLSRELVSAVQERIDSAQQTILFLNRRGFSSSLLCVKCGYRADCDACSVACTYHRQDESLRCHICGQVNPVPRRCPACGDPQFKFAGVGTQRVENVVKKCFPRARVQRMDADVTGKKDAYDQILGDFRAGRFDILIGTQMIAKGLHLPNVTLVGVIYADLSLHVPDFRAGERTFQLLAQVAGRAGRGEVPGEVIIQTFTPHHPAVQAARRTDFVGFSDQEIEFRRELSYPPFAHMVCITFTGVAEEKVTFAAGAFVRDLEAAMPQGVVVSPPTPAPIARMKGRFRYQVFLRGGSTMKMVKPLKSIMQQVKFPQGVKCNVDVDALSLL